MSNSRHTCSEPDCNWMAAEGETLCPKHLRVQQGGSAQSPKIDWAISLIRSGTHQLMLSPESCKGHTAIAFLAPAQGSIPTLGG